MPFLKPLYKISPLLKIVYCWKVVFNIILTKFNSSFQFNCYAENDWLIIVVPFNYFYVS